MSNTEITSYVSVAALAISLLAIALSLAFFWINYKISRNTERAAEGIEMSIDKVEGMYNGLVNRFFSTIDETMADYRKHAWSGKLTEEDFSEQVEKKADEKFEEIRKEMSEKIRTEVSKISRKTGKTDAQVKELQDSMEKLFDEATTESREIEKDTALETAKNRILVGLLGAHGFGRKIVESYTLFQMTEIPSTKIFLETLSDLKKEELITMRPFKGGLFLGLTEKGIKRAEEIKHKIESKRAP